MLPNRPASFDGTDFVHEALCRHMHILVNKAVIDAVFSAVNQDVDKAVYRAVDKAVHGAASCTVGSAVNTAVNETVDAYEPIRVDTIDLLRSMGRSP